MANGTSPHLETASSFSCLFQPLLTKSYLQLPGSPKPNYYIEEEGKKSPIATFSNCVTCFYCVDLSWCGLSSELHVRVRHLKSSLGRRCDFEITKPDGLWVW